MSREDCAFYLRQLKEPSVFLGRNHRAHWQTPAVGKAFKLKKDAFKVMLTEGSPDSIER